LQFVSLHNLRNALHHSATVSIRVTVRDGLSQKSETVHMQLRNRKSDFANSAD